MVISMCHVVQAFHCCGNLPAARKGAAQRHRCREHAHFPNLMLPISVGYRCTAQMHCQQERVVLVQVNEFIDPNDFGLSGAWCPLVYGKEALGCQRPTFEQLLQMSSGLLPSDNMACGVPGVDSTWTPSYWFWKYRYCHAPSSKLSSDLEC